MASELELQISILQGLRQAHSIVESEYKAAYEKFCLENNDLMASLSSIKMKEATVSEKVRELTLLLSCQ